MSKAVEQLKQRSPGQRFWAGLVLAVSLVLVTAAERDIHQRPDDQLRGNRWVWRLVCLNALGAVNYFAWGRRPEQL